MKPDAEKMLKCNEKTALFRAVFYYAKNRQNKCLSDFGVNKKKRRKNRYRLKNKKVFIR